MGSAEFRGNTEQRTAVLDLAGVYYRTMGDEKRALRLLQEAFDTIASSPDADLRRKVICDLGATLGNLAAARRMLAQVVDDSQSTPRQVAECLTHRSTLAQSESDPPGASADAERFSGHCIELSVRGEQPIQRLLCLAAMAWLAAIDHLSNMVDPDHPLLLLARELAQGWKVS